MTTYILQNRHLPEECQALDDELPWPAALSGVALLCTCPSGEHGGILAVEAENADEALAKLTPKFRAGTRAYAGEVYLVGEQIPVA
ncbi:MAG: hypothetical protein E6J45_10705 [Chloroflexi bacterium]|nr:MAG: hypothetical protein E6J45_10705 [Chloroflexota bacterium]